LAIDGSLHRPGRDLILETVQSAVGDGGTLQRSGHALSHAQFDSLEMDQYTDLHLLSQQVMETIVQIQEITSDIELSLDDAEQVARSLNKTSKQFQTGLNQVRMRPLAEVVDRFPRALRELCLEHGKQAELSVIGSETLVERTVLEALADPLMHLFRNAFDHGLETPDQRRAQGKPETGLIEIKAMPQGNHILITLRDDGNGIPLDKVRAKAMQMGLDEELINHASDQELVSLIFEPGFSTSDRVTDLSGRGVGMDVVRDSLRQINGDITVDTQAGRGTTFTLSVPYTRSVVAVQLVESNGMLMALPSESITATVMLQPGIQTATGEILWQNQTVPLLHAAQWMQFHCQRQPHALEMTPDIDATAVLVLHLGDRPMGLVIDRAWGEQDVALRRIEGNLGLPAGFTSCAIIGDGRVVPVVDAVELIRRYALATAPQPTTPTLVADAPVSPALSDNGIDLAMDLATERTDAASAGAPTVLIIDDSINVRRFLAMTLEKGGFRVEQAKDGQDGIEKLQQGLAVQAIICDIEMPRLDGYGFLTQIKSMPSFAHLPVAMLTSRSGEKHRQLALALGASEYFSKPYNEQDLLQSMDHMVRSGSPRVEVEAYSLGQKA
jgi:two-component system, chemotaxis family, sensor histidine kinase and response regulator PixL